MRADRSCHNCLVTLGLVITGKVTFGPVTTGLQEMLKLLFATNNVLCVITSNLCDRPG